MKPVINWRGETLATLAVIGFVALIHGLWLWTPIAAYVIGGGLLFVLAVVAIQLDRG